MKMEMWWEFGHCTLICILFKVSLSTSFKQLYNANSFLDVTDYNNDADSGIFSCSSSLTNEFDGLNMQANAQPNCREKKVIKKVRFLYSQKI